MRIEVSYKYLENSEFIQNILDNNFKKLDRKLKSYKRTDPIHISVHIEKNPHKDQFFCRSHVYLPTSKVLIADEKGSNSSIAINKSFSAISRQLSKEKQKWQSRRRKEVRHRDEARTQI